MNDDIHNKPKYLLVIPMINLLPTHRFLIHTENIILMSQFLLTSFDVPGQAIHP
ncbi:hypothetical protein BB558_003651 [Smittium angustum]|uniref:Uncharacterized protein n=1 Tax=Smittium angustum TaxID=133377 RepID=A0A2U1J5E8_SMIAN|nr:hypothetical protein BB558_003651 [Smittium angustum]